MGDVTIFPLQQLVYPSGAVPITASNTGSAGAALTVSLPATPSVTNYLTKAIITCASPASQVSGVVTISDGTQTLNFQFVQSTSAGGFMNLNLDQSAFVAVAANTAITVTIPSITGGAVTAIALLGFQK